jgi:hypothetical protein
MAVLGDGLDEPMPGLLLDVDKCNAGALTGELPDDRFADAGSAPGNEYCPTPQAGVDGELRIGLWRGGISGHSERRRSKYRAGVV